MQIILHKHLSEWKCNQNFCVATVLIPRLPSFLPNRNIFQKFIEYLFPFFQFPMKIIVYSFALNEMNIPVFNKYMTVSRIKINKCMTIMNMNNTRYQKRELTVAMYQLQRAIGNSWSLKATRLWTYEMMLKPKLTYVPRRARKRLS